MNLPYGTVIQFPREKCAEPVSNQQYSKMYEFKTFQKNKNIVFKKFKIFLYAKGSGGVDIILKKLLTDKLWPG